MAVLHVPSFSGGVILAGSPDAQATTEMRQADNWDIGLRGQLSSAPTAVAAVTVSDLGSPVALVSPIASGATKYANSLGQCVLVAFGHDNTNTMRLLACQIALTTFTSVGTIFPLSSFALPTNTDGTTTTYKIPWVTYAPFPYVNASGIQTRAFFVNIGGRYDDANARQFPGLYVYWFDGSDYNFTPISQFDALGTGAIGEFTGGTHSIQLHPRGICAYNNFLFCFGFDNNESLSGEGPARLMFSNIANPFKFGNDNLGASGTDRAFSDSDAIQIGASGESITALLSAQGKLWIGTNRGLHYLQGYGRDSFTTDGTTSVASALDVAGPYAMIEGPDGNVYGISSRGLWRYVWQWNLSHVEHLYRKVVAFDGTSNGYWDLLSGSTAMPGSGNIDLAWMRSDIPRQQVWIVIPGCNATTGEGLGPDTVIIKYHIDGGGFTRQVIYGVLWLPACDTRKGGTVADQTLIPASVGATMVSYGEGAPDDGTLMLGEYAPFGPDDSGIVRTVWLTVSWPTTGTPLPITATITPIVDQQLLTPVHLTIGATAPVSPVDGDVWVDTSGSDTNIGNATAGAIVPATNDYLCKRYMANWGKWTVISSAGGMQGVRATIPIAFNAVKGARNSFKIVSSAGSVIQFEGLGIEPSTPGNS